MNIGSKVALVSCDSYDYDKVKEAVDKAFDLLGGLNHLLNMPKESSLLLKPNLLAKVGREKACTTDPAVFAAVGEALQESGYKNLTYGDSPGNPMVPGEKVAEECGIKDAAHRLRIPVGQFDEGLQVDFPQGRVENKFILCREVTETDGIINICKMKTHQLERITGAVKNTFGCVYGLNKSAAHARYATAEVFGKMIADLNRLLKPKLHIMDGIVAMEGNGPQSGTPKAMNLVLVSKDPVALDGLFCHLVSLNPELVPTNVSAMEQSVGTYRDIQVVTEEGILTASEAGAKYGDKSFDVQRSSGYRGTLAPLKLLAPLLEKKPIVKKALCIGCGICVSSCPLKKKAIEISEGKAVYDYSRCIKCYCCQEMCPEEAITVKKSLIARIADRNWML
ncbi:MAG: DUF362 domain-containing protein [Clostridiales bacterium]|nr:DUF362 domain-containing protein [Clostridiales bacterium]